MHMAGAEPGVMRTWGVVGQDNVAETADTNIGGCSTVKAPQNTLMESEKFEAIGPRGEACIILMQRTPLSNGQTIETYTLATGDKLRPTEVPGEYTTVTGTRTFRLRKSN